MRARGGALPGFPSASTPRLSQRKFRYDAPAPSRNPPPALQPPAAIAARVPIIPSARVARMMRPTARANAASSIVAGVLLQLPDELHESRRDPQQQERNVEEVRVEGL